jgi:predicted transposase YbfD/YdcC
MASSRLSIPYHFATLRDPRRRHLRRHRLLDILTIALCAVIAGANTWPEVVTFGRKRLTWLRRHLPLRRGIPSHDTFERVFAALDPQALQTCLLAWVQSLRASLGGEHIAIDGKTSRHSGNRLRGLAALQLVSAWATEQSLLLGQVAVAEGSNEITAVPRLLELLDLKGALVTLDALHCQRATAAAIIEGGGDYVLTVKGNQKHLQEDIAACFTRAFEQELPGVGFDEYQTTEWGHGRQEVRRYLILTEWEGIRESDSWEQLKVIGLCHRERTVQGETGEEVHYFIGSRVMSAHRYGEVLRDHWQVENGLHWQLDVNFGEDASRIQQRRAATNFGLLRRLALSLLKQHPEKGSIACKRLAAAMDTDFLEEVLNPGVI